jgi:hypothetical protein
VSEDGTDLEDTANTVELTEIVAGGGDADPEPAWPLFRYLDDTLRLREVEWSQQR